jgi:hypothetical protein
VMRPRLSMLTLAWPCWLLWRAEVPVGMLRSRFPELGDMEFPSRLCARPRPVGRRSELAPTLREQIELAVSGGTSHRAAAERQLAAPTIRARPATRLLPAK